ncbi:hypothetical protein QA612_19715 [Evansella sp. AB-P1]|uniref:hypothetical protein n=1 Tax=Evansella sp. AB-P1 TaxID=3037653 RepID=UPI00241E15B3|nr:hypothetical protein [Evansella sp. AB-P1]MDG5789688.1 hypothetical protein [Evansella sp. AB-P1]
MTEIWFRFAAILFRATTIILIIFGLIVVASNPDGNSITKGVAILGYSMIIISLMFIYYKLFNRIMLRINR